MGESSEPEELSSDGVSDVASSSGDGSGDLELDGASRRWRSKLIQSLNAIQSVGNFAVTSRYPRFVNPGLQIKGPVAIPLPLATRDAEVIKSLCTQAPFGRGDQTLVDTAVRKTWELDSSQFQLVNPEWPCFFDQMLKDASVGLGLTHVTAKPHKLLLYEEGSFFKRHKDSEKEAGMVGTLVVCLPSQHDGGDVHLSFGGRDQTFATGPTSAFDLVSLAWFSDVTHEVKELTKGYRLALVYKLIQAAGAANHSPMIYLQQSDRLQALLSSWPAGFPADKLVYPLEHQYTKSSLSLQNMKGRDRAVCQTLRDVCFKSGLFLLFAHMTHSSGEEDDYYGGLDDESTELSTIYACDGKQVGSGFEVESCEILADDIYKDRAADSEDEGEFTGNESAPSSFRYHDTVAMLVPKRRLAQYLRYSSRFQLGPHFNDEQQNFVTMVIEDLGEHPDDPLTKSAASAVLTSALNDLRADGPTACAVLKCALELKDMTLYKRAVKAVASSSQNLQIEACGKIAQHVEKRFAESGDEINWSRWLPDISHAPSFSSFQFMSESLCARLETKRFRLSLTSWMNQQCGRKLESRKPMGVEELDYVTAMIEAHHDDSEWITTRLLPVVVDDGTSGLLYQVLNTAFMRKDSPKYSMAETMFRYILERGNSKLSFKASGLCNASGARNGLEETMACSQFVVMIDQSLVLGARDQVDRLLQSTYENLLSATPFNTQRMAYNIKSILVVYLLDPLASKLKMHAFGPKPVLAALYELLIQEVFHRQISPYPTRLPGWRHRKRGCGGAMACRDCDALNKFLHSDVEKVWRFPAAAHRRKHIESLLPTHLFRADTEKSRSPHTLVVTKLGKEFAEEQAKYAMEVQNLERELMRLRGDFLRETLGEEKYSELILCEKLKGKIVSANGVAGLKRQADEAESTANRRQRIR